VRRTIGTVVVLALAVFLIAACTDVPVVEQEPPDGVPEWIQGVVPEPSAVATVPDAVEVDHNLPEATDEEMRLIVDGVDVTTYAEFDAGKLRYESGDGPVVLSSGDHTAEVQRVLLPADQTEFRILDSFSWEFRVA
jgi:hypothetical protein